MRSQRDEVKQLVFDKLLPVLYRKIDNHKTFLQQLEDQLSSLMGRDYHKADKKNSFEAFKAYKQGLLPIIEKHYNNLPFTPSFDYEFGAFNTAVSTYLESVHQEISKKQRIERFKKQSGDGFLISLGKFFKRGYYRFKYTPLRLGNFLRRIFKKKEKPVPTPQHKVKLRNLSRYYLKEKLGFELVELIRFLNKQLAQSSLQAWRVDETIDKVVEDYHEKRGDIRLPVDTVHQLPDLIGSLELLKKELAQKAEDKILKVSEEHITAYHKVGTIELSNRKFSAGRAGKFHDKIVSTFKGEAESWANTFLALSDDWEIDVELYQIVYLSTASYYAANHNVSNRLQQNVLPQVNAVRSFLQKSIDDIKAQQQLTEQLVNSKLLDARETLPDKVVQPAIDTLLKQDLPAIIYSVEASIKNATDGITAKRNIIKSADYTKPQKSSSISQVSPAELVGFESWPALRRVMNEIKAESTAIINQSQEELLNVSQIVTYNLESVTDLLQAEGETKTAPIVAMEGYERALEKVDSAEQNLANITRLLEGQLLTGVEKFNSRLKEFTDNENIYEIRLRIARAKAIEKSKQLREKWINSIRYFFPIAWNHIRNWYYKAELKFDKVFKRYGLSHTSVVVSTEMADFLAETQEAIGKLPFVYQRLFRTTALEDMQFFEGRGVELNQLHNAYNNWTKGRVASTVLIGEKGCGLTTILNYYLQEITTKSEVYRLNPTDTLYSTENLVEFFSSSFNVKLNTLDDINSYLLKGNKKLVVLENLQHLFLKKVNGFEAINALRVLISNSKKNVFWVVSCTQYAWNFLLKVTPITDHFSYHIKLGEFDDKHMTDLILKRHSVSGYGLHFLPSAEQLNNKKFKKLSEDEQQEKLQEGYFSDLNKIARGNISLALIYWLRSTERVAKNTIYIMSLKEMDFSFMKSMSNDKLYTLTDLLLHDGLTAVEYGTVTCNTDFEGRNILTGLADDGVLIEKDGYYNINPLLYRQTITLLETKNILH